ncbi:DUF4145 domain-containing protein [Fodinibius sp. Rm-B-1B1-1]|uniref:DUF4145 domain-containing protein n=1 Tax=Fodinibius alkaliphilus TaxID=3140241 RepID=UPI00315A0404
MYIDFHKYNYDLVPNELQEKFEKRDKDAYENIINEWINDNIDDMIDRKWEIEEIQYLSETSDFIKLIREAESLYELGFYTSCIALIGVSAEDFLKYLAIKLGKPEYENDTQYQRSNNLLDDGLITQDIFDSIDDIRKIRNDCLHYNDDFKVKNEAELKRDALNVLNSLKSVIRSILFANDKLTPENFVELIKNIAKPDNEDARNFNETIMKLRNVSSHLLKFPTAFSPDQDLVVKEDFYKILDLDIDFKETTIEGQVYVPGATVVVDLTDELIEYIKSTNLEENNVIYAIIVSEPNQFGMTAEWDFYQLKKINDFEKIAAAFGG